MLINLWVKDKRDGTIHQVGADVHDSIKYLDGEVVYAKRVELLDTDDYVSVTPEQLYLNRELVHKDLMEMLKGDFNNAD